jgi:hypothetical protein
LALLAHYSRSTCHCDGTPSLLALISGSKELWIAPADVHTRLASNNNLRKFGIVEDLELELNTMANFDPFEVWRNDGHRTLMLQIGWRHVALFAGSENALVIPKGWWHCVRSTPETIGEKYCLIRC